MQMDKATQQNAALVEESAAAAESMKVQAEQLVEAVARFKVSGAITAQKAASPTIHRGSATKAGNVMRPAFGTRPAVQNAAAARPAALPRAALATGTDNWESF